MSEAKTLAKESGFDLFAVNISAADGAEAAVLAKVEKSKTLGRIYLRGQDDVADLLREAIARVVPSGDPKFHRVLVSIRLAPEKDE